MSLIWTNITKSGLCDRLIDMFLVASMAKLYNKKLYMIWGNIEPNEIQKKIWNPVRFDDYKIDNLLQYFTLPSIINIVSHNELTIMSKIINKNNIIFPDYIGGEYSPISFYNKFINKSYTLNSYIEIYYSLIKEFKPTQKLLNLVPNIPTNIFSVHLRRTDKSTELISHVDSYGVSNQELIELNNKTKATINKIIIKGYYNIYFASDDIKTKEEYERSYNGFHIYNPKINLPFEQTYVDIYIMSISKYIIVSQRHTNFSLFSSLINKTNLIYFFNDSIIHNNGYKELGHFSYFTEI